jgi:hypothetical protein
LHASRTTSLCTPNRTRPLARALASATNRSAIGPAHSHSKEIAVSENPATDSCPTERIIRPAPRPARCVYPRVVAAAEQLGPLGCRIRGRLPPSHPGWPEGSSPL